MVSEKTAGESPPTLGTVVKTGVEVINLSVGGTRALLVTTDHDCTKPTEFDCTGRERHG